MEGESGGQSLSKRETWLGVGIAEQSERETMKRQGRTEDVDTEAR